MQKIIIAVVVVCVMACANKQTENNTTDSTTVIKDTTVQVGTSGTDDGNYEFFLDINNYLTDLDYDSSIMQIVDSSAAIVINPTDEQITQMEKEMGEEDLATVADDASYYQSDAVLKLDSNKITTLDAAKPYLLLKGKTKTWKLNIRKKGAPEWNIILFNTDAKPEVISGIDVTNEKIKAYFKQ